MDADPVAIYFEIPATDSLGRMNVDGKLRSDEDFVYFHWKIRDRAFSQGENQMQTVEFPYEEVEEAELHKPWFSPAKLVFRIRDPRKLADVPGVNMGRAELVISKKSLGDATRFVKFVAYKTSEVEADRRRNRLNQMMDSVAEKTAE